MRWNDTPFLLLVLAIMLGIVMDVRLAQHTAELEKHIEALESQ